MENIVTTKQELIEVFSEMTMKDRVTQSNLFGDVLKRLTVIEVTMSDGFKGVHDRQDKANGKLNKHEESINGINNELTSIKTTNKDNEKFNDRSWTRNITVAGIAVTLVCGLVGVIYKIQYDSNVVQDQRITEVKELAQKISGVLETHITSVKH